VPDRFRAADLTDAHYGRRIRVDGHVGVLLAVTHIDDSLVQVLLVNGGPPSVPIVGAGVPVTFLD
jgi:hypothetical protein